MNGEGSVRLASLSEPEPTCIPDTDRHKETQCDAGSRA